MSDPTKPLTPRTSDGKAIVVTAKFPGNVDPYYAGAADLATNGRAEGDLFAATWTQAPGSPDDKTLEWKFGDWIYASGGIVRYRNAGPGDHISCGIKAKATVATAAAGNGNANKVATGLGFNVIVPAAGNGSWQVEQADMVPVPSYDANDNPTGYWAWSEPETGRGTLTGGAGGSGSYNLYDADIPLTRWVAKMPLLGDGVESLFPETKARKVLPHWTWWVTVHNQSLGLLQVSWTMAIARKATL